MNKRRQLPLPDDTAPRPRKPAAPLPGDETPPPPLPSRGAAGGGPPSLPNRRPLPPDPQKDMPSHNGKKMPPLPPQHRSAARPPPHRVSVTSNEDIEDTYADADAGEVYAECDVGEPEDQQENYDDFSIQPDEPQQEVYDEFDVEDEAQEEYDEFAVGDEEQTYEVGADMVQDVYEAVDDGAPAAPALPPSRGVKGKPPPPVPSTPSPPPPPPPAVKKQEKVDLPKARKPPVASKAGLDLNEILNRRNKLKSVSLEETSPQQTSPSEPKEYADNMDVKSRLQMFKQKEEAAGLASPGKKFNITNGRTVDKTDSPKTPKLPELPKVASEAESPSKSRAALPPIPTDDLPPPPPVESPNRNGQRTDFPPPPPGKNSYTQVQPKNIATPVLNDDNQAGWPDDYDQEDIYDDAITNADPLMKFNWYFGMLDREKGNTCLKKVGKDGTYLMRKSNKGGSNQPYTLMVLYSAHVYNLKIRLRRDGKYALGEEKPDEITFDEVDGLVEHHQSNDVILVSKAGGTQSKTLLKYIPD